MPLTKISGDVIKDGINVSGILTATKFIGDLTGNINSTGVSTFSGGIQGNVTGNITGNVAGNVIGNVNSTGVSTFSTLTATSIVGVVTAGITTIHARSLVGVSTASITTAYVGSINDGPLAGFRNATINGNFDIWQRGTSFTNPASGTYTTDRWVTYRTGSSATYSRQSFTLGQNDVPGEPTYFFRSVVTSSVGAGNFVHIQQRIESVRTFAGQQITVSFWAKADSSKPIAVELEQNFATGGSPSATIQGITATKVTLGTSWQKVTVTANLPSISGKTLGSDGNDHFSLNIWFDAGSTFNSRTNSLGQQSGTFDIAQVQVEAGPVATPFEKRPIGTELALCQRYYETGFWTCSGITFSGNGDTRGSFTSFAVTKRVTPSVALSNNSISLFCLGANGAGVNLNGSSDALAIHPQGFSMSSMGNFTNLSSAVGGGDYTWALRNGQTWNASAEL